MMKTYILLFVTTFLALGACAECVKISGTFKNGGNGKVVLTDMENKEVGTGEMRDGNFVITCDMDLTSVRNHKLFLYPEKKVSFVLGVACVTFFVDSPDIYIDVVHDDKGLRISKILGSRFTTEYNSLYEGLQSVKARKDLSEEYKRLSLRVKELKQKLDSGDVDLKNELLALRDKYKNSETYVSLVASCCGELLDYKEIDDWSDGLDPRLKDNYYVKKLTDKSKLVKQNEIGGEAFVFELVDTTGKTHKLTDYRGKYVLLDFWASWCGPCRGEIPNIDKAAKKYRDRGLVVIGISSDRKKADWLKALREEKTSYLQLLGTKECNVAYNFKYIPYIILLDPEGKIIAKKLRGKEIDATIEKYLKPMK